MHTACARHVHACARHVHGMCTACALHAHGMCTATQARRTTWRGYSTRATGPTGCTRRPLTRPSPPTSSPPRRSASTCCASTPRSQPARCLPPLYHPVTSPLPPGHQPFAARLPPPCRPIAKLLPPCTPYCSLQVEPARWYYHADRLGMLVWQDMPSPPALTCKSAADGDPKWAQDPRAKEPSDNGDKDENRDPNPNPYPDPNP